MEPCSRMRNLHGRLLGRREDRDHAGALVVALFPFPPLQRPRRHPLEIGHMADLGESFPRLTAALRRHTR
jgi:hypothetical protein